MGLLLGHWEAQPLILLLMRLDLFVTQKCWLSLIQMVVEQLLEPNFVRPHYVLVGIVPQPTVDVILLEGCYIEVIL